MRIRWLVVGLSLGVLAPPAHAGITDLFLLHAPLIALVGDELWLGEGVAQLDRTGTLSVRSTRTDTDQCNGRFRYTSLTAGVAELDCSNGEHIRLAFLGLGLLSGYGRGNTSRGEVRFTFGLTAKEAEPYLSLAPGQHLRTTAAGPILQSSPLVADGPQ